jgi:hypothetical protein
VNGLRGRMQAGCRRGVRGCVCCLMAALALGEAPARAQSLPFETGRIDVSAGVIWIGRVVFSGRDANETTGSGGTFRLFSASTELTPISGFGGRLGVTLLRSVDVEVSGAYATPELRARIASDAETSNAPVVATVPVRLFTFAGAAAWYPPMLRVGSRARLFVRGGIGSARHLEDRDKRAVDGRTFEAGGGMKYVLVSRSSGWWKGAGARVDLLALVRTRNLALDDRAHVSPVLGASLYLRF